jgi:hypothetical protein
VDDRIPIGFELALGHKSQYYLNIDLKNATLEDVLNEIVGQETATGGSCATVLSTSYQLHREMTLLKNF